MLKFPPTEKPSLTKHDFLIIILALIGGVAINLFPMTLLDGADLVFGNVFAIIITARYGLAYGALVSVCCSLSATLTWGYGITIAPNLAEVAIVHYALKFKRHPISLCIVYWLSAGAGIVYLSYSLFTDLSEFTVLAVTLKYIINGVLTCTLGYTAHLLIATRFASSRKLVPFDFRLLFVYTISTTVLLGSFINSYFWLDQTKRSTLVQLNKELQLDAEYTAKNVEDYLRNTLSHLDVVASTFSMKKTMPDGEQLTYLSTKFPGILTMLVADEEGQIKATFPQSLLNSTTSDASLIRSRSYFSEPKATEMAFMSGAFRGRGFGSDPIVALSAPIVIDRTFRGIIQASLSLGFFATLDNRNIHSSQKFLILDNENKVVYSSSELHLEYLADLSDSLLLKHIVDNKYGYFTNSAGDAYIIKSMPINSINWKTVSFLPAKVYENELIESIVAAMLILCAFIAVAMIFGSVIALKISKPISLFSNKISDVSKQGDFENVHLSTRSPLIEIRILAECLNQFSNKYRETLLSLRLAAKDANQAKSELETINSNLEKIISDKTQDITRAMVMANQANEAKSEFLANMSHEIRTPLNGIVGILQILEEKHNACEQVDLLYKKALFSARSLTTIVDDVLDFSKIESGELHMESIPFRLDTLIEYTVSDYYIALKEKNVSLNITIARDCTIHWLGDPLRLRQILANILSNAVKFTEQGQINLVCKELTGNGELSQLQIQVSDTGIGMSDAHLSKLFERFSQADVSTTRKYGGTGLGMAITQRLLSLMNSDISCQSELGKGTTFTITLNLQKAESGAQHVQLTQIDVPDLQSKTIAIVEDNDINLMILRTMLEDSHAKIFSAKNGEEAVELSRKLRPDLILMDVHMPVMDGIEATKIIIDEFPLQKIIAVTANALPVEIEKTKKAGCIDYLAKPLKRADLIKMLQQYLVTS